ncbi:hypothetical protein DTL21_12200 [Bremerella cremea]|uniref:Peptidase M12B domain-containing protein n=1 Tax=Blastopirellula marina TaxID=124 RepID=A0A2S8FQ50_9BACT|nr:MULTISPECIES: M12 family metallo-peptidase [Pirellulaceae]PQO34288.1 hypothetical protein C5Y83_12195 [Blastopirellula marina]RCS46784.1 hypothetical protein DTL21_12200 [Bremerella cremea]
MKRRGLNRQNKRRINRLHHSRIEHLETRALLSADLWQKLDEAPENNSGTAEDFAYASAYETLSLDISALRNLLATAPKEFSTEDGLVIELPRPDGSFERFEIFESQLMAPELAAQLPQIKTFYGQSIDNPDSSIALDVTQLGFHAQVIGSTGAYLIDPYYFQDDAHYASYFGDDAIGEIASLGDDLLHEDDGGDSDHNGSEGESSGGSGTQTFQELISAVTSGSGVAQLTSGTELRTYRLAVAATGEFGQNLGSQANAMAAIVTANNRIDAIYRRDLSIHLELVGNNMSIVYVDPASDPYPVVGANGLTLLAPNQTEVDATIGNANYDLSQVYGYDPTSSSYGVARLGSAGVDGIKAQGVAVTDDPLSPYFALVSAHEFGHMFGADHTWSYCYGPANGIGVEPGGGTTIMGYPPLCGPDSYVADFDPYFHAASIDQIIAHVDSAIPTVGTRTATNNQVPTVDGGGNYTIPANTPFVLTSTGTDGDGDELTYTWDQVDQGDGALADGDLGYGPLFRYIPPTTDNSRTFPSLDSLVNNTTEVANILPSTDRTLNFEVTVRDSLAAAGGYGSDNVQLTVVDTGSPFQTTAPMPGETLAGGQLYNFEWDVAGTDSGAINTQNVRIAMSTDGGYTYPYTVIDSTSNDGEELLYVPNQASTEVRFRVEAVGNIFFDITNGNVTVLQGTDPPTGGPVVDACGVPLPDGTVSFSGAIGGNFYASNRAILDGEVPGMLGYDYAVLDFLRGKGTAAEIAKANYSIAVVGNGLTDWSFSNGGHSAPGYERTDFYNINYLTASVFDELISHDLIIVLSGEDAVTDGLSSSEMALWATVETDIAEAVNARGLDLWVGASGGNSSYYDFLPTGVLSTSTFSTEDPLDGYEVTLEGSLLGITDTMVDSAPADGYFDDFDNDLFGLEYRELGEITAVAGQSIAFYNDELVAATDVPGGTSVGMVGLAFQDLDMDGVQDDNEVGVGGARFFLDYNGDGVIGLCEPTATSDSLGRFQLRSGYSGHFQILPVPTAGTVVTSTNPIFIDLAADGTATLSAPLTFGVLSGADSGNGGDGSAPIAPGAFLGSSPIVDDGVIFNNGIKKGANTVTIISSVTQANTVMNAWFDFNKDGDWDDAGERIFTNVVLRPGQHEYTFNIPTTVFDDSILPTAARLAASVRFRVGPTLNVGPEANDSFGEIEDYKVYVTQGPDAGLTANNDVFEYLEDTDGQFFNVLANDSSFYNRTLSIVPGSVTNISPVTDPALDISVSTDGTRIIFNAGGVSDLTQDITFQYTVEDTAGNTETATVTLVAPLDPTATGANGGSGVTQSVLAFHNSNSIKGDVNNDGSLTGLDLVKVIKQLQTSGSRDLPEWSFPTTNFSDYIDVNGDGRFSYLDLLSLVDAFTQSKWEAESLEAEPAAIASEVASPITNKVVETFASPQIAEVAAPISKSETISPVASSSSVYIGWQSITTESETSSTDEGSQTADTSLVVDEAFSDAGFDYSNGEQDDLLLSVETDSEESDSTSSRLEDEIFGDEQWDEELLAF